MARFANFGSSERVKGKLQVALYHARKNVRSRRLASAPLGLRWDNRRVNPSALLSQGSYRISTPHRSLVDYRIWEGAEYYVKGETGNDSNDGSDFDNALRNIHAALTLGNATSAPYRIFVDADEYCTETSISNNGSVSPTQSLAIIGVPGVRQRAEFISGKAEDTPSWTLDSGTMYSTTQSSVVRALDMSSEDIYGLPKDLEEVEDSTACAATNNSYAIDGSTVFVNIGSDPAGKIRLLRNFQTFNAWTSAVDIYLENFEIWGGGQGCFVIDSDVNRNVVGSNVRFMAPSSANKVTAPRDAFSLLGTGGLIAFFDSEASLGHKDGWNFHRDGATDQTYVLLVNCNGYRNGNENDSSSNNFTTHDDVISICIGCNFAEAIYGNDVHCIQNSRSWFFDCSVISRDTDGTSTCFKSSNDSFMWIEESSADAQDGDNNYTIEANGGTVFIKSFTELAGDNLTSAGGTIQGFT